LTVLRVWPRARRPAPSRLPPRPSTR
jgi:hypothetical protein